MKIYYHDPDSLHNKALMYFLRRAAAIVIKHFFCTAPGTRLLVQQITPLSFCRCCRRRRLHLGALARSHAHLSPVHSQQLVPHVDQPALQNAWQDSNSAPAPLLPLTPPPGWRTASCSVCACDAVRHACCRRHARRTAAGNSAGRALAQTHTDTQTCRRGRARARTHTHTTK